jgi:hypothetical protein
MVSPIPSQVPTRDFWLQMENYENRLGVGNSFFPFPNSSGQNLERPNFRPKGVVNQA